MLENEDDVMWGTSINHELIEVPLKRIDNLDFYYQRMLKH